MSKMSKIVETVLDKKHREYVDDASKAVEHMQERSLEEDEPYKIPKGIYRTKVSCWYIRMTYLPDKTIFQFYDMIGMIPNNACDRKGTVHGRNHQVSGSKTL